MKKDYLFYGAFGIGVIALVAVLATYNLKSQNNTKEEGIDLNASNYESVKEIENVDVLGEDVTAEDQQKKASTEKTNAKVGNTTTNTTTETAGETTEEQNKQSESIEDVSNSAEQTSSEDTTTTAGSKLSYNGSQTLTWPATGDIILPYSMDSTVYFQTLEQYKCNPGMLIGVEKGEQVLAVYAGIVEEVGKSNEYGEYLVLDLGNGYEVYYGQLEKIHVEKGDTVSAGDPLASVGEPSSFFEKEGCHLYIAVTKDDKPINPVVLMAD